MTPATGPSGRSSSARAAGSRHVHAGSLHAARRRDGAAQRPRPLHPPQRGRLDLGRARRRDHRVQPRRAGLVLRPGRPTRSTGTRRSTTSPKESSTCDVLSSTYALGLADDALDLRPADGLVDQPRTRARGGRRAGQHRPRPARPGAHAARATPASSRATGRTEDDLAYLRDERDFRNVQLVERAQTDFGVAMARLLVFSAYQSRALRRAARQHRRDAGRRRRQGGQGGRLPRRPRRPLGAAAGRRHRRVPRADAGALDAEWPYVDELFDAGRRRRWSRAASPPTPLPCAPPCSTRLARRGRRGDPDRAARSRPRLGGGRAGCTPRTSATCSPRCSTSPARTRGRRGDRQRRRRRAAPGPLAAEVLDPEMPVVTIEDLGILRDVTEDDQRPGARADHADLLRLPGDGGDPPTTSSSALTLAGLPARRRRVRAGARPGPPTGSPTTGRPSWRRTASRRPARPRRLRPGRPSRSSVRCPQCGSLDTRESSRFGSTACKSLWVCRACREPFDHFKAL